MLTACEAMKKNNLPEPTAFFMLSVCCCKENDVNSR